MDGTGSEPGAILAPEAGAPADRRSRLDLVLGNHEQNSTILESLDLTLAIALLDHAIAEVRRHAAV